MLEALAMLLCQQMPVADVAELLGEEDTHLWRMVCADVEKAQAERDWSGVTRILVDETSARRGQRYVTNFVDAESRKLLLMVEGRKADIFKEFVKELYAHGGDPARIAWVGMDMSGAYAAGVAKYLPHARKAFDHFRLMALAGVALDEVRRSLHARTPWLKGSRWSILGNEWTRSEAQQIHRRELREKYPKIGRALGLRESLQDALGMRDKECLIMWCEWAQRCRLAPFVKLAATLKKHWEGILGFFESGITNAAIESMNGKIQLAKRMARGFRNFKFFRAISYLKAANLSFALPSLKPA